MSVNIKQNGLLTPIAGMDDQINDSTASSTTTYSSNKINTLLGAKADTSSLATVATSGSYNDLSDKPTIPSATEVVFATGSFVSSTSDATTITATNSSIDLPSGATIEVCADIYNYPCSDVSTSGSGTSATITAVFPKDTTSRTINYKIYAKTI